MKPIKLSVAVVVADPTDAERVLVVRRPPDDDDLPNTWGLPAASLRDHESWEDAALRAGREKLGVELAIVCELNRGEAERDHYRLVMRLYQARLVRGQPAVARRVDGATQYYDWQFGTAQMLQPAAARGSLCCRLFLQDRTDH
ncbi:MAG: NUDIX hydrolase [Longimicrobiales bacterium]